MAIKNSLKDLNNLLFEQLERLVDADESDLEGIDREIKKSDAVSKISEQILRGEELKFKHAKYCAEQGIDIKDAHLLECSNG